MEVLNIINSDDTFSSTKQKLNNLGLVVKEYAHLDLYLVKYDKNKSNMEDENVKKCRGLIARMSDNKLVCFPPQKSTKIENVYNSIEQWNFLSFEDFIDGTMINLFFHNGQWLISTRSNIGADCYWFSKKKFSTMFDEACNINFDTLDKNKFYSFVFILKYYCNSNIYLKLVSGKKIMNIKI